MIIDSSSGYLSIEGQHVLDSLLECEEKEKALLVWGEPLPDNRPQLVTFSGDNMEEAKELLASLNVPFIEGNEGLRFDREELKRSLIRHIKI